MEVLIRRCAALALLLALAGCGFLRTPAEIDPPTDTMLVHAVLQAGSDTVRVLLTRPHADRSAEGRAEPISGATVRVAGGGSTALLREAPEGFGRCLTPRPSGDPSPPPPHAERGCYAAVLPGGVRAGERYLLEVDAPGGRRATGETVVPAAPEWIEPVRDERLVTRWSQGPGTAASLMLRWRSSAASMEIPVVVAAEVYAGGSRIPDTFCSVILILPDGSVLGWRAGLVPSDSVRVRVQLGNCVRRGEQAGVGPPIQPDSAAAELVLAGYDAAYAAYLDGFGRQGVRAERASSGLKGAFGVFGSVAAARRRVVIVVE